MIFILFLFLPFLTHSKYEVFEVFLYTATAEILDTYLLTKQTHFSLDPFSTGKSKLEAAKVGWG